MGPLMADDPHHQLEATQAQLAAAQEQLTQLDALLRELPDIFERKFQQRLQPLLERQAHLLEDNQQLRQQLRQLTASTADVRRLGPPQDQAAA